MNNKMKVCVVGSGPSGAATAYQLVKNGHDVVMYDPSVVVEKELTKYQNIEKKIDKKNYLSVIKKFRKKTAKSTRNIPAKLPLGSNFTYALNKDLSFSKSGGTTLVASMAMGGLSNSWGANVNGILDKDMQEWPIDSSDLKPYFETLRDIVPVAGDIDDIDELYGIDLGCENNYQLSSQAKDLIRDVDSHKSNLKKEGVYFGRAKLAIGKKYSKRGLDCEPCGLCMHGCPYNLIFNSASVISELKKERNFTYIPNHIVLDFKEDSNVTVRVKNLASNEISNNGFDKVYIGAGVVGTTAVVARSLDWCEHDFTIKDSTKFLFPFIRSKATKNVISEETNTLSQIYIQFQKLQSTQKTVHMQLYGYNDLVLDPLRKVIGDLAEYFPFFGRFIINRFMIGMIYLHSDDSGHLKFKVESDIEKGLGHISGENIKESDRIFEEIYKIFKDNNHIFKGKPLKFLTDKNQPGNSQHFGGSLPMREKPGLYETDKLGVPFGCENVHVIDSSIVTSVTGTPTTYTVMANALRISDQSIK